MSPGSAILSVYYSICIAVVLSSSASAQTFTDRTDLLHADPAAEEGIPFGASSVDFDGDGLVDIYQKSRLYRNTGEGGFVDVFPDSELDEGNQPFGAIFGDYDDDGLLDVFFMDLLPPSHLFGNDGDGSFTRTDQTTNLETDEVNIQGSVWLDSDNDGDLDLFVGGDGDPDVLFENNEGASFSNADQFNGLMVERGVYGVAASDFDRDGDIDIYVSACRLNDIEASSNLMWINDGGTFHTAEIGVEDDGLGWGTVWFDYDNDGWTDLFVSNDRVGFSDRSETNILYHNNGDGTFENVTESAGVGGGPDERGFSAAAADFDNDGWVDLYVLNYSDATDEVYTDNLYRNAGDGTFTDVFQSAGLSDTGSGAVTVADYDEDGYVDIFLGSSDGGVLYMNDGGSNHWLEISLRGTTANRFGVGSRIDLFREGELWQTREISAGDGMTSQNNALMAHFGLADVTHVDSLQVSWPGGDIDHFYDISVDRHVTITQGAVSIDVEPIPVSDQLQLRAWPNPFDHQVNLTFKSGASGSSDVRIFDLLGREIRTLSSETGSAIWDGTDASGSNVSPGMYLIRITTDDRTRSRTVIRTH